MPPTTHLPLLQVIRAADGTAEEWRAPQDLGRGQSLERSKECDLDLDEGLAQRRVAADAVRAEGGVQAGSERLAGLVMLHLHPLQDPAALHEASKQWDVVVYVLLLLWYTECSSYAG